MLKRVMAVVLFGGALSLLMGGCPGTGDGNDGIPTGGGGFGGTPTGANQVFAVIGDYGDDDDNSRAVATLIRGWDPDFIITTGDNDYSDGAFRGTFDALELGVGQYFHEFIGDYQGDQGPGSAQNRFFPTPGDHDWGDTCDDPAGLDDYLRYFTLPAENSGNERYYDFQRGDVHFFSVHSLERCEPDGVTPTSTQGTWVRDAALASSAPFKIAYFHNPPYSSGDRHVGEGAHMRWPWNDWGFDLVFSGDDHIYERVVNGGVTYIVNGLGGVDIHGLVNIPVAGSEVRFASAHGAVRVDVFDDRMEVSFITVDGIVVDTFTIQGSAGPTGSDGSPGPLDPDVAPITQGDWYRPTVSTTWQWQLQPDSSGEINTTYAVDVYDVDLFDVSDAVISELQADGRKVICYFSAGSFEDFRDDAGEFLETDLGNPLSGFADERWLDVRSSNVQRIMLSRLDLAVQRGCDGVEPDNVDGVDNDTGFDLTPTDQLAYTRFLANEAHSRGLAVALKNDLDQITQLVDYFDFSVNEECHEFDECDLLQPFIDAGKPVFNAEYADVFVNDVNQRQAMCTQALGQNLRTLVLPIDLDDSFRFSCEP